MLNSIQPTNPAKNKKEPAPARLLAISIAIMLVVATAFCLVIQSFSDVRLYIKNDTQDNIEIITNNAELGRNLVSVEADVNYLLSAFLRHPEASKTASQIILAKLDVALKKSSAEKGVFSGYQGQVLLGKFTDVLRSLVNDYADINQAVAALDGMNKVIFSYLNAMEKNTGKMMTEHTLASKEPKDINEIYTLIAYCREQIQQIRFVVEQSISSRNPDLLGPGRMDESRIDTGTALALNFRKTLETLTSSGPKISSHAKVLLLKIPPYMTEIRHLRLSLESLAKHHNHLATLRKPIIATLNKTSTTSANTVKKIKAAASNRLQKTTFIIYAAFLALSIITILGWLLIHIRTREMLKAIHESASARADLETKNSQLQEKITENYKTDVALRESEERYRDLFENASDLIQILANNGRFLYVNRTWRKHLGYSKMEIQDMTITDIIHPDCRKHCMEIFQAMPMDKSGMLFETTLVTKDGESLLVEGNANLKIVDGQPVSTRCILRNVTEKRRMQEELYKSRRIESVGVLAAGIAHDFNNLLTAIIGNISLAKLHTAPDSEVHNKLVKIEKASLRAQDLTKQLLTFSKDGTPVTKTAAVPELVEDSAHFSLSGSNVRCHFTFPDDLYPVEVDEGQICQVIQNLITNADQAMPNGGEIFLSTANVHIAEMAGIPLAAGQYVKITVRDEGPGIGPENLDKIFDPYFSTKEKGHGLGLAVCYSILRKHHGHIECEQVERGASFSVYLPASTRTTADKEKKHASPISGHGRILLMDDEEIVREISGEMLTHLGYEVELSVDGEDTIAKYKRAMADGCPFDVVIMDITIPGGMGGKEAIYKLREIDPQAKAIVSSGYAKDPAMTDYDKFGFSDAIPKPYKINDISEVLYRLLSRDSGKHSGP